MPHDPTKIYISRTWHTTDALSKSGSTNLKYMACSSLLLEYTKISSIKTNTNRSKNGLNTWFLKFIKTVGVLVNPKDITKNS